MAEQVAGEGSHWLNVSGGDFIQILKLLRDEKNHRREELKKIVFRGRQYDKRHELSTETVAGDLRSVRTLKKCVWLAACFKRILKTSRVSRESLCDTPVLSSACSTATGVFHRRYAYIRLYAGYNHCWVFITYSAYGYICYSAIPVCVGDCVGLNHSYKQ